MPTLHYYADLHTHSRHSRATSPTCTPEGLCRWAQLKGVTVCGSGDCTHPAWLAELKEKLAESAPGLYAMRPAFAEVASRDVPLSCRATVHFMVTGEISSVYRRDGKVRKVHSLVLLPSLEAAARLNVRLARCGNILSDGRPTLGLDPRDLLEILLETDPRAALVPAHIWTPWFSVLGSKSGFDSLAECFGDLTPHVFAAETGLSSDAPMNHRIRGLDGIALVANSDLHSPSNLGRNANLFRGRPSYEALLNGLRAHDPDVCGGTVHLFPEEGKYHLDGHRSCGVRMSPDASMRVDNLCPACGKPLTIGVLHRIVELERRERDAGAPRDARGAAWLPHRHVVPLAEILSQRLGAAPQSKRVAEAYRGLLDAHGPELHLLLDADEATLAAAGETGALIAQMRAGRVVREGGYDGLYGTVRIAAAAG